MKAKGLPIVKTENIDGAWKHGGKKLTNTEKERLKTIGWRLPNG